MLAEPSYSLYFRNLFRFGSLVMQSPLFLSVIPYPQVEAVELHFLRHAISGSALYRFDTLEIHDATECQVALGICGGGDCRNVLYAGEHECDWVSFLRASTPNGEDVITAKLDNASIAIPIRRKSSHGTVAFEILSKSEEICELFCVETEFELASLLLGGSVDADPTRGPAVCRIENGEVYYWWKN